MHKQLVWPMQAKAVHWLVWPIQAKVVHRLVWPMQAKAVHRLVWPMQAKAVHQLVWPTGIAMANISDDTRLWEGNIDKQYHERLEYQLLL